MKKISSTGKKTLSGFCCIHIESGYEGPFWAVQDSLYIKKNVGLGHCKKCGIVLANEERILTIKEYFTLGNFCKKGDHEEEIGDYSDRDGLHILKNGDHLAVYSKVIRKGIIWSGIVDIDLISTEVQGLFIRVPFDQKGVERELWEEWFWERHPATLTRLHSQKKV